MGWCQKTYCIISSKLPSFPWEIFSNYYFFAHFQFVGVKIYFAKFTSFFVTDLLPYEAASATKASGIDFLTLALFLLLTSAMIGTTQSKVCRQMIPTAAPPVTIDNDVVINTDFAFAFATLPASSLSRSPL